MYKVCHEPYVLTTRPNVVEYIAWIGGHHLPTTTNYLVI
jgi:hypothetical protein